jgi:hypothetical protein
MKKNEARGQNCTVERSLVGSRYITSELSWLYSRTVASISTACYAHVGKLSLRTAPNMIISTECKTLNASRRTAFVDNKRQCHMSCKNEGVTIIRIKTVDLSCNGTSSDNTSECVVLMCAISPISYIATGKERVESYLHALLLWEKYGSHNNAVSSHPLPTDYSSTC